MMGQRRLRYLHYVPVHCRPFSSTKYIVVSIKVSSHVRLILYQPRDLNASSDARATAHFETCPCTANATPDTCNSITGTSHPNTSSSESSTSSCRSDASTSHSKTSTAASSAACSETALTSGAFLFKCVVILHFGHIPRLLKQQYVLHCWWLSHFCCTIHLDFLQFYRYSNRPLAQFLFHSVGTKHCCSSMLCYYILAIFQDL